MISDAVTYCWEFASGVLAIVVAFLALLRRAQAKSRARIGHKGDDEDGTVMSPSSKTVVLLTNRIGTFEGATGGGSYMREVLMQALETEGYNIVKVAAGHGFQPDVVETVRGPMMTASLRNQRCFLEVLQGADLLVTSGTYTPLMSWAVTTARLIQLKSLYIITTNSSKAADASFSGPQRRLARTLLLWNDRWCAKLATAAYTRSAAFAEELRKDFGIEVAGIMSQNSQYEAFFPFDPLNQDHVDARASTRQRLTMGQPHRPLYLFAGRFRPEKRIPLLVRAFRQASAEGTLKDAVLAIVGKGEDSFNIELGELHDPQNGIHIFADFVDKVQLRACYFAADVHVSASDFETLGNTVHESLLCGTPVVVQRAGGYLSQVMPAGSGASQGFLVDFEAPAETEAALQGALAMKDAAAAGGSSSLVGPITRDTVEGTALVRELLFRSPALESPGIFSSLCFAATNAAVIGGLHFPYSIISTYSKTKVA